MDESLTKELTHAASETVKDKARGMMEGILGSLVEKSGILLIFALLVIAFEPGRDFLRETVLPMFTGGDQDQANAMYNGLLSKVGMENSRFAFADEVTVSEYIAKDTTTPERLNDLMDAIPEHTRSAVLANNKAILQTMVSAGGVGGAKLHTLAGANVMDKFVKPEVFQAVLRNPQQAARLIGRLRQDLETLKARYENETSVLGIKVTFGDWLDRANPMTRSYKGFMDQAQSALTVTLSDPAMQEPLKQLMAIEGANEDIAALIALGVSLGANQNETTALPTAIQEEEPVIAPPAVSEEVRSAAVASGAAVVAANAFAPESTHIRVADAGAAIDQLVVTDAEVPPIIAPLPAPALTESLPVAATIADEPKEEKPAMSSLRDAITSQNPQQIGAALDALNSGMPPEARAKTSQFLAQNAMPVLTMLGDRGVAQVESMAQSGNMPDLTDIAGLLTNPQTTSLRDTILTNVRSGNHVEEAINALNLTGIVTDPAQMAQAQVAKTVLTASSDVAGSSNLDIIASLVDNPAAYNAVVGAVNGGQKLSELKIPAELQAVVLDAMRKMDFDAHGMSLKDVAPVDQAALIGNLAAPASAMPIGQEGLLDQTLEAVAKTEMQR